MLQNAEELEDLLADLLVSKLDPGKPLKEKKFSGWEEKVRYLFPYMLSAPFLPEHIDFWSTVDSITPTFVPDNVAFVLSRDFGKSSTAEAAVVYLLGEKKRRFIIYLGAIQAEANRHVMSIRDLIESSRVQSIYPDLGKPRLTMLGKTAAWRQQELQTASGAIVLGYGLDAAARGVKVGVEGIRPDALMGDDFDKLKDSIELTQSKVETITKTIIPTRGTTFWIGLVQNVIRRESIMHQVMTGSAQFLRGTRVIGPVPAVDGFEYEELPDGKYKITKGTARWPERLPLSECEKILNESGPEAFLSEYQHMVDFVPGGAIYPMWDERIHIVTIEELVAVMGRAMFTDDDGTFPIVPKKWEIGLGHDWGATLSHPAICTCIAWPDPETVARYQLQNTYFNMWTITAPQKPEEITLMTPEYFGEKILEKLGSNYSQIQRFLMSHEAASERNTYIHHLTKELVADPVDSSLTSGIAQIKVHMKVNYGEEHQFKRYPDGYRNSLTNEDISGKPVMGRSRYYVVVAAGYGELVTLPNGSLDIKAGIGDAGQARCRWERRKYNWRMVQGVEKAVPPGINNDFHDAERYICGEVMPSAVRETRDEKLTREFKEAHPKLQLEYIKEQHNEEMQSMLMAARQREMVRKVEATRQKIAANQGGRRRVRY